jgi:hypothetical protein
MLYSYSTGKWANRDKKAIELGKYLMLFDDNTFGCDRVSYSFRKGSGKQNKENHDRQSYHSYRHLAKFQSIN